MEQITKNSPLAEEEKPVIESFVYTDEESRYLKNLQKRLEHAKDERNQARPEFDGMTYPQYWKINEELANVELQPKKDKSDIQYQSETLRTKLFAFLSSLIGLNLSPDIVAFDRNNVIIKDLGNAIEDIQDKCSELDQDEEKQILRFYELLKQGTVFVEEVWDDRKTLIKDDLKDYKGEFRGIKIKTKKETADGRPVRNIISGLSVYLGDWTKYLISEQPYIFTVTTMRYDEAEKLYGSFDMFKYVKKTYTPWTGDISDGIINNSWRLNDEEPEGQVEIIKYQDLPNKEYQLIINGVPMLPIGCPFPWGFDEYNITQQNLKPIRADFAYGKSFVYENKNSVQLLDELKKLSLLKTYKSYLPPYINNSGRVISSKVFMPATITSGITPGTLVPLSDKESQGVTQSEFAMIQEMTRDIDANTASQAGSTMANQKGGTLEVEAIEVQRQAKIMLGVIIASMTLLEKKLGLLRMKTILKYWFDPIDKKLDDARNEIKNVYRIVSTSKTITGEGLGMEIVAPTDKMPSSKEVMGIEDNLKTQLGMPVRVIALDAKEVTSSKLIWTITVIPKEKKSSDLSKLMFQTMISNAIALGLPINMSYIQEEFASMWEKDPSKLFTQGNPGGTNPNIPTGNSNSPGVAPIGQPEIKKPVINLGQDKTTPQIL